MIHFLYSQIARTRRRYYQRRPHLRRRLEAPVISVGNLTVGGSGKTPLVGEIASILINFGERPAILSRGYGRQRSVDGVVVVSDGAAVHAGIETAGDEPYMLARSIAGAAVLVSPDRYLAGRLAETRLGRTVHILDDGFQHLGLARDIDLLVTPPDDFVDVRTLPSGRFREPLDAAAAAGALLVPSGGEIGPGEMAARLGVPIAFGFERCLGDARLAASASPRGAADRMIPPGSTRVFAVAGIAKPDRFFSDLERAGWQLVGRRGFRDHHQFSVREVEEIGRMARQAEADLILTTEKDLVRWPAQRVVVPVASIPLRVTIESGFHSWLRQRLADARQSTLR